MKQTHSCQWSRVRAVRILIELINDVEEVEKVIGNGCITTVELDMTL